jgi:hypothetical protein
MGRIDILLIAFCANLFLPCFVWAQSQVTTVTTTIRDPLNYPLRQYGFILAIALLGGAVSWYGKVRKGELKMGQLGALVGELTTSAMTGLLAFWVCEYLKADPLLTACLVGVAGHAGGKAIEWAEELARKRAEAALGVIVKP